METLNSTVVKEDVLPANLWTKQDQEGSNNEVVVNEKKKKPKRLQHGVVTKLKLQVVVSAQAIRKEKYEEGQKRGHVAKRNGVQIIQSLDNAGSKKKNERSSEVEYVSHQKYMSSQVAGRVENKGERLKEKQGSS